MFAFISDHVLYQNFRSQTVIGEVFTDKNNVFACDKAQSPVFDGVVTESGAVADFYLAESVVHQS